ADLVIELKLEKQQTAVDVGGKVSSLANSDPVYRALRTSEPTGSYKVSNFLLQRDVASFTFESGQSSFAPPVMGTIVYAVCAGKGRFTLRPIVPVEGAHVEKIVGNANVGEEFKSAVLVFTDGTEAEIKKAAQSVDEPSQAKDAWREFQQHVRTRPEF